MPPLTFMGGPISKQGNRICGPDMIWCWNEYVFLSLTTPTGAQLLEISQSGWISKVKGQCARWAVWVPRFRKLVAGVKFIQRQNAGSDGLDIALVFSPLSQRTSTYMDPNGGRHCGTHQTWP